MSKPKQEYSFLDLARDILLDVKRPLTAEEIYTIAEKGNYKKVKTKSSKPVSVLNSSINQNINVYKDSIFYLFSSRPAHWGLKELKHVYVQQNEEDLIEEDIITIESDDSDDGTTEKKVQIEHYERALHKLLASYVHNDIDFDNCYVQTIFHEKTKG